MPRLCRAVWVALTLASGDEERVEVDENTAVFIAEEDAFWNDIVAAAIPEGVTAIGDEAFRGCTS